MVAGNATNARSAASSTRKASRSSASQAGEAQAKSPSLRERLRLLYFGKSQTAHRFRYGLLTFDISTILFIIGTSFVARDRGHPLQKRSYWASNCKSLMGIIAFVRSGEGSRVESLLGEESDWGCPQIARCQRQ